MRNSAAIAAEPTMVGKPRELKDAIELLANFTDAYTAALFVASPDGQTLHPAAFHCMGNNFRDEPVAVGEGLVGYVFSQKRIVDLDRYNQDSSATGLYTSDAGIKSFLGIPIGDLGVLVLDSKRAAMDEKHKKLVRDFARFLGHLLAQRQVKAREELYGGILDLIYEVENASVHFRDAREFYSRVLAAGERFTGLSMGFICLLKPGRATFTVEAVCGRTISGLRGNSYPVNQGLVGWVLKEGRPLSHGRVRPQKRKSYLITPEEPIRGYDTFIGVPIAAWRRLTGVWAYAGEAGRKMDEEEERALQVAGHRVAATIEHYHLSESLKGA